MKRLLLTTFAILAFLCAAADEGMWLPSLIGERIGDMRKKGFKLQADDIYSLNQASLKDAVVLFGSGCTGELVSAKGLLLTNHHCGYGAIQRLSTVARDLLTYGYWAMSPNEELPCEGLTVSFLVRMDDITARIAAGEKAADIEAAAKREGKGYDASVEQMYYGNQQFLFVYKTYRDIRLVGAPPSAVGKFGGDTDNWIWPRHTGDFSMFRIYADADNEPAAYSPQNRPYTPRRSFTISTRGVREGDFTMIYGFPGSTQQYITSDAVRYISERSDPMKIAMRTERLRIIAAAQAADPAVRIQYAAKHASIANAWKKWQGEVLGINRLGTVAKKAAYEQKFISWAADKPQYAHLTDSLHEAYRSCEEQYFARECLAEGYDAIELLGFARIATLNANATAADIAKRAARLAVLYKDYNAQVDRAVAKRMVQMTLDYMPAEYGDEQLTRMIAEVGGVEGFIDRVYDNSLFTSADKVQQLFASGSVEQIRKQIQSDAAVKAAAVFARLRAVRRTRNLSDLPQIARLYKPYLQALREFDPQRAFFPDANLTLRVAYGRVGGYEYADGEYHTPFTTLDGVIAKDNPDIYDYNVPAALRTVYDQKDYGRWGVTLDGRYTVPVCFLASNQTTGGNSGSPVLNARGELVGINFDRTWRSTMSDVEFDPTVCRNISVDIRYVLFMIDRVGGAGYLLQEMRLR